MELIYDLPFYIGDYFKIKDDGYIYTTFLEAFKHFGILDKTIKQHDFYYLKMPKNYKTLVWRLCGIAKHCYSNIFIGHFKSNQGHDIVFGLGNMGYLEKIKTNICLEEHNKRLTEKLEIKQIKK